MSEQSNILNRIRAEKISQLDLLPDDLRRSNNLTDITDFNLEEINLNTNWDKLYFVLALNDGDKRFANFKLNFSQLLGMLIDSGQFTIEEHPHVLNFYNMDNFTIDPSNTTFNESRYNFTIIPNNGYVLPDSISVRNVDYVYDNETGKVYLENIKKNVGNIDIDINVLPIMYRLQTSFTNVRAKITPLQLSYSIKDIITIDLFSPGLGDVYNVPKLENIVYNGLMITYDASSSLTHGKLICKLTGTQDPATLSVSGIKASYYCFGYTTKTENVLIFNDDYTKVVSIGMGFRELEEFRDSCPIPFTTGFKYGNGSEMIAPGDNVYIIVPKRYSQINGESILLVDDNGDTYALLAGRSSLEMTIQKDLNNEYMKYSVSYKDVDYWVLCISTEGKYGTQNFTYRGNIANTIVGIQWVECSVPEELWANEAHNIKNLLGYIDFKYADGHTERYNGTPNFTTNFGSLLDGVLTLGELEDDEDERPFKLTVSYNGYEETRDVIAKRKDADYGINRIIWIPKDSNDVPITEMNEDDEITLMFNEVFGIYSGGTSHVVGHPENVQFSVNTGYGTVVNNTTYIAPTVEGNPDALFEIDDNNFKHYYINDSITVTYNVLGQDYTYTYNIKIKQYEYDFDSILWDTLLPQSIFDNETIRLNQHVYKVKSDGTYEQLQAVSFSVSSGTLFNGNFKPNKITISEQDENEETNETITITAKFRKFSVSKDIIVKPYKEYISDKLYFYVGHYKPYTSNNSSISYSNPQNDLVDYYSNLTGWREIENQDISVYSAVQFSLPENGILINNTNKKNDQYYVVLPKECVPFFASGATAGNAISNILIGHTPYILYEFTGNVFNCDIYYQGAVTPYWYAGFNIPNLPPLTEIQTEVNQPGWHIINSSISNFSRFTVESPLYDNTTNEEYIIRAEDDTFNNGEGLDFYIALPSNFVIECSDESEFIPFTQNIQFNGVMYKTYWKRITSNWVGKIYYAPSN